MLNPNNADVIQLVECVLAKHNVAGSSPAVRSKEQMEVLILNQKHGVTVIKVAEIGYKHFLTAFKQFESMGYYSSIDDEDADIQDLYYKAKAGDEIAAAALLACRYQEGAEYEGFNIEKVIE